MEPLLARVARAQGGVFSRAQARECGYSEQRIRTELATRRWLVVIGGVYRLAGAPSGWNTRVWSALLAAGEGAVLGGRPAGRIHRIDGVPAYDRLEVVVPANRRPRRTTGARIERAPLRRADVTRRGGIPILSAPRTVVDLARRESTETGARIVGDALRTGVVAERQLRYALDAAGGRQGAEAARTAVALADPRLESVLEAELLGLVAVAGVPVVPQYEVVHKGLFVGRLDFAAPALRLGLEADGYAVHALRAGFERDRERQALLQLAGWTLLSFTAAKIRQHPKWVVDVIRDMAAQLTVTNSEIRDASCG